MVRYLLGTLLQTVMTFVVIFMAYGVAKYMGRDPSDIISIAALTIAVGASLKQDVMKW